MLLSLSYVELIYLVELIVLGLVSVAVLAIVISIIHRSRSVAQTQKEIILLKQSVEKDALKIQELLSHLRNYHQDAEITTTRLTDLMSNFESKVSRCSDEVAERVKSAKQSIEKIGNVGGLKKEVGNRVKKDANSDLILDGIDINKNKPNEVRVKSRNHNRPIIGEDDAESLTNPSLIDENYT